MNINLQKKYIDSIPILYSEPEAKTKITNMVIFIDGFSSSKENAGKYLLELADAGFFALSFDPWQHGERTSETTTELFERVFSNIREYLWPIIGLSVLEVSRIIDWGLNNFNISNDIFIGGISMGGDIALSAAGFDKRIKCISGIVCTSDWLRPDMKADPEKYQPQGEPDSYSSFFYNMFNPMTHISSYNHIPAINLECGELDYVVPPAACIKFIGELKGTYPNYKDNLNINIHPKVGHIGGVDKMWENSLRWFNKHKQN